MELDTTLSIDVVIAILVVFGAVWRLDSKIDGKISELRGELKEDYKILKADIGDLRSELKADSAALRNEFKADISDLRNDLRAVEAKVDDCNQRLARLEGIIIAREDRIDPATETNPAA